MMRSLPHRGPVSGVTIVTDRNGPCPKKPAILLTMAPLYRHEIETVKKNRSAGKNLRKPPIGANLIPGPPEGGTAKHPILPRSPDSAM
jgi:hypothetical protein